MNITSRPLSPLVLSSVQRLPSTPSRSNGTADVRSVVSYALVIGGAACRAVTDSCCHRLSVCARDRAGPAVHSGRHGKFDGGTGLEVAGVVPLAQLVRRCARPALQSRSDGDRQESSRCESEGQAWRFSEKKVPVVELTSAARDCHPTHQRVLRQTCMPAAGPKPCEPATVACARLRLTLRSALRSVCRQP